MKLVSLLNRARRAGRTLLGIGLLIGLPAAHAATYTWTGAGFFGSQDYLWSNPHNWAGLAAPTPGEANVTIVFPNNNAPKVTTNDIVGLSVASIQFQGSNYVVHGKPAGNSLGLQGGFFGWTVTASHNGNYFAGTAPLVLHNSGTVGVAGSATLSFLSSLSGPGGLTKTSPGTLKFAAGAANTYTGATTVYDGTLDLNNGTLFPSATHVAIAGPLVIGSGDPNYAPLVRLLVNDQIGNTSPVTVNGNGRLWLNGKHDTIGALTLVGGAEVSTGVNGGWDLPGLLTLNGNVTNLNAGNNSYPTISGRLDLGLSSRTFQIDFYLQVNGSISGSGLFNPGITKTGTGNLVFHSHSTTNTYTGHTFVQAGKLTLLYGATPGATNAGTTIAAGATLELHHSTIENEPIVLHGDSVSTTLRFTGTNAWSGPVTLHGECHLNHWNLPNYDAHQLTLSGAVSGPGGLRLVGGQGALHLSGTAENTFSGPLHCDAGLIVLDKHSTVAVPGDLVVGLPTGGAPAATVQAKSPYQFKSYNFPEQRVTVNPSGQFFCGGYDQNISNLELRDGWVDALGGNLVLLRDLTVETVGSGHSYVFGKMTLLYGNTGEHQFEVRSNAVCWLFADVYEAPFTQHLTKTGTGTLAMSGSNVFNGTFTIEAGTVYAAGVQPFGTTAGPTVVKSGATLAPVIATTAEALSLAGSGHTNGGALRVANTNTFTGPITLAADTLIHTETNAVLSVSGVVSGPGGFTKQGFGTMRLLGANANTYAGGTVVTKGKLELGKTNATAIPGPLTVTGPDSASQVRLLQPEQIADSSPVVLQDTGWIALDGNSETIGSLSGTGAMFQSGNQTGLLTVGGNNDSTTFHGNILGGGGLTKAGTGTFTLTGNNLYTGTTTVNAGTLLVMGQQPQSSVTLLTGGRLGGSGRVGHVSDLNGHVSPGASIGILVCSNYSTFTPANRLEIEINGATPGSGHDQLHVFGNVLLMGGTLQVTMNTGGAVGTEYVIIQNDGSDPVTGSFTGLPEGAMLTNNGAVFQITYQGGDGNDVVLQQKPIAPAAPTLQGQSLPGGSFKLTSTGQPNVSYAVEATSDLAPPITWRNIGFAVADAAGQIEFTDPDAVNFPMRFYRLNTP